MDDILRNLMYMLPKEIRTELVLWCDFISTACQFPLRMGNEYSQSTLMEK